MKRSPLTALAFGLAGIAFFIYPAIRPSGDDAVAMASDNWVSGHLSAMLGFVLLGLAVLGLHQRLGDRLSLRAAVVTWIGAGLTLPYYGAEDFGLHVIARHYPATTAALAQEFRFGTIPVTMFAGGLAMLGVGAIMAAVAVWRTGVLTKWSAVPLAAGFALFIPQFFGPYSLRIAHGVLIAVGGLWLAFEMWRSREA
ncbi:hypothetical protein ACIBHX_32560 [Nonomuraea sp. NPDC050536]|uniref:hypothetical protein n=1 Tax=Nonomuraea sp. NPDC050536 TaxID=3364366 RepID=UPI0037C5B839